MKEISRKFLDEYFKYIYKHDGVMGLYDLYKIYSEFEVDDISQLKVSVSDFCDYLKNNIQKLRIRNDYPEAVFIRSIESFNRSIDSYMDRYLNDVYKRFAKLTYELSPSRRDEKVLEVGAGKIPSSSLWLRKDVSQVKTIDTEFYLSKSCLKNLGVDSEEKFFDKTSDIGDASFVVGRCPCTAIKYMVKKCANKNIPYLIKLCDCDIVVPSRYSSSLNSWREVLRELNPENKIFRDYAYKLDVSEEQLKGVLDLYDNDPPVGARRGKRCSETKGKFTVFDDERIL